MSAHVAPLIFLCRMAVYAAALVVLATARLPDPPVAAVAVAPTAALIRRADRSPDLSAAQPSSRPAAAIRIALAAVLVLGIAFETRRPAWR